MRIALLHVLILFHFNYAAELSNHNEKKIVCFYTGQNIGRSGARMFTPRDIDPMLCTHLVYAYAGLGSEDKIIPRDLYLDKEKGGYTRFNALMSYNKKLKTLLSIGKGLSSRFSTIAANEERRNKFAKNAVMFLRVNRFSGINLSWQFPGSRRGSTDDKTNYVLLVQALREEFEKESNVTGKPGLLLTMDVPHTVNAIDNGFDIPSLIKYLDFINVFTFNYRFPAEVEMSHHAPLYPTASDIDHGSESQNNVDFTIKHYLNLGVCRDKLVMGIPTYGRTLVLYEPEKTQEDSLEDGLGMEENFAKSEGLLPYYEICNMLKSKGWKIENSSSKSVGPYAHYGNFLVGFDDQNTVKQKAQYAGKEGLGGIMFWTIEYDDFNGDCHGKRFPLIEAGKEAFLNTNGQSEQSKTFHGIKGKPLFSFKVDQEEMRINLNPDDQYKEGDIKKSILTSEDDTQDRNTFGQFNTEDKKILEQLVWLIKRIGGVSTLERLLGVLPRTLEGVSPLATSLRRSQLGEFNGQTVTSMTVTSPPLTLRKTPNPLVFSNFTVNIQEVRIDAGS